MLDLSHFQALASYLYYDLFLPLLRSASYLCYYYFLPSLRSGLTVINMPIIHNMPIRRSTLMHHIHIDTNIPIIHNKPIHPMVRKEHILCI